MVVAFTRAFIACFAVFAVTSIAACSLLVSTSDLSDPATNAGNEAGALDAATQDVVGSAGSEAGGDGAADAAPAKPFRCADHPGAFFCADFDQSTNSTNGWTGDVVKDGTLTLAPSSRSAPSALVSTMNLSASEYASARLYFDGPNVVPPSIHIELDVNVCSTSGHELFKVELVPPNSTNGPTTLGTALEFGNEDDFWFVSEGYDENAVQYVHDDLMPPLPNNQWVHLSIDATLRTEGGTIRILVDDKVVLERAEFRTLSANTEHLRLVIGSFAESFGTAVTCATQYDNVLVTVEP